MILVGPCPDEVAAGHIARVGTLNGVTSRSRLVAMLKAGLRARAALPDDAPIIQILAMASGMESTNYAVGHTMLPALRVASKTPGIHVHGSQEAITFSRRLGMLTPRTGAYCCEECITQDLADHGFSWFRRSHQLFAIDRCLTHDCALSKIVSASPFELVPHVRREQGELQKAWPSAHYSAFESEFVVRYVEIANGFLLQRKPMDTQLLHARLAAQARKSGLRLSAKGRRPLLSDFIREQAPELWLKIHFPGIYAKTVSKLYCSIDNLLMPSSPAGTGGAYALVAAALLPSAESALSDMFGDVGVVEPAPSKKKPRTQGRTYWQGGFWYTYLEGHGNFAEIARKLGMDRDYVRETAVGLGLPSLVGFENSSRWKALVDFCEGASSLTEACDRHQVDVADLEALLRQCGARVVRAIHVIEGRQAAVIAHEERKS